MKTILILLLSCNLYAQQWNDTWDYTYDKSLHLWYTSYISFAASPIYASRDKDNINPLEGFAFGVLFGTGVNVAKELYDWTGRGHASKQDIAYGMIGSVIGSSVGMGISILAKKAQERHDKKYPKL